MSVVTRAFNAKVVRGRKAIFSAIVFLAVCDSAVAGSSFEIIHEFKGKSDGAFPETGLVIGPDGSLYGTTHAGGNSCSTPVGCGTVFKLTPPRGRRGKWKEEILYRFKKLVVPSSLVVDRDGILYGTLLLDGIRKCGDECGVVFRLAPPAIGKTDWTYSVIYRFTDRTDGYGPSGLTIDANGTLYGTTAYGGKYLKNPSESRAREGFGNLGTVFSLVSLNGRQKQWIKTTLYNFSGGSDGAYPDGPVTLGRGGALFGATNGGGGNNCAPHPSDIFTGCGTVFMLTPPSSSNAEWVETVLHSFSGGSDGFDPNAPLVLDDSGALYGTTRFGGSSDAEHLSGHGTIFRLSPPLGDTSDWIQTVLYRFTGGEDGMQPVAGLVADRSGALYGTAFGIVGVAATVFKLSPPSNGEDHWVQEIFHKFPNTYNSPYLHGVAIDGSGNVYGIAENEKLSQAFLIR